LLLLGLPPLFVEPMAKLSFIGIVITILMSSIVVYHLVVLLIYRRQLSPEYKKMAKWIYIAFFINILLVVLRGIIYELPWGEMFTVFEYMSVVIYLLIPLAFVYTAGRYHLLDLELRLRRNIQYVIISGFWIVLNIAAFGVVIWYLASSEFAVPNIYIIGSTIEIGPPPIEHSPDSPIRNIILIAFAFLAGYFFWELGKAGLRFLDRKFYRIKFDYGRAATKITELMEKSISAQDLARSLVDKLGELISLKRVGVIIFKDERIVWAQEYYGFKSETLKEFCRMAGDRISEAIAIFKGSFRIDYLPSDLKNIFQECKFLYIIPIRSKGNLTGAIFAGEKLSEISFRNEDLEFLSSIARQASVAIENSFLYEELAQQERMRHELEIARRIQLATLPQEVPRIEGLDIAGVSIPALEVGGDFYDYLNGGSSSLTVVVGDVSGKGTSAALYMSKAQGIMRTLQEFELPPAELLRRTNKLLYKSLEKSYFITAITANIDTNSRKVSFARAGHLPMYHYRYADGSVQRHVPRGLVLGLSKGGLFSSSIQEAGFEYAAGDIFLFITDGVTESRNSAAEEFGERRLMASLKKYAGMPSGDIMNNILSEVSEFSDEEEQFDDMTIVVVKTVSESGS
jgi:serine phosphatase RsbU (regulator of sigma subunit)